MKIFRSIVILFFFSPLFVLASGFNENLSLGTTGQSVLELQRVLNLDPDTQVSKTGPGSPGQETSFFGRATRDAVIRFQDKHKQEVLFPAGLSKGTGFAGTLTRKKLLSLQGLISGQKFGQKTEVVAPVTSSSPAPAVRPPQVFSVSPSRVRAGDKVTVSGENFTPTGNLVRLRFGVIESRFEGLSSPDGKNIIFTYIPPVVRTITKNELEALPPTILDKIMTPLKAAGGSVEDIVQPYRNIKNKAEFADFLRKNNQSLDDLHDYFFVTVENSYGVGSSKVAMLWGERNLNFGVTLSHRESFFSNIETFLEAVLPQKAFAQIPYGGYNSGFLFPCTCGPGYMTFMLDISTNGGSSLYWIYPGFVPISGTPAIPGPYLGKFTYGGICMMNAGLFCFPIVGNMPNPYPWGEAPF